MKIKTTSLFRRSYKKLPAWLQDAADAREDIFRNNIFDSRLKTHKLHGKHSKYWAFSVIGPYRVMFELVDKSEVIFINIGDHDIYK